MAFLYSMLQCFMPCVHATVRQLAWRRSSGALYMSAGQWVALFLTILLALQILILHSNNASQSTVRFSALQFCRAPRSRRAPGLLLALIAASNADVHCYALVRLHRWAG